MTLALVYYTSTPCYGGFMTQTLAFPYYRWSDAIQARGDTLRRQSAAALAYAAEHDVVLADPITVAGISAHKGRHRLFGALADFLRQLEDGHIPEGSLLLLDSFDRLSRETVMEAMHLLTGMITKGVVVVTMNDSRRYDRQSDMMHLMYALMQFARSYEESAEKGRKVREALDEAKAVARATLKPWSRAAPFWLDIGPDGQWCEKRNGYTVVRRIFDAKERGVGNAMIARALNADDIAPPRPRKPKKGEPARKPPAWTAETVGLLASARAVFGEYQPRKNTGEGNKRVLDGEPIPNFYPEVISRAQFDRVQSIVASRQTAHAAPRSTLFTNLIVGLTTCERCGGTAGYSQTTTPSKPHLKPLGVIRCNRVNVGACDNRTRIKYDALEAELLPFIAGLPAPKVQTTAVAALADALARHADLEQGIQNVMDLLEKVGHDQPDILDRLIQRRAAADALQVKIARLEADAVQERGTLPPADWRAAMADLIAKMSSANAASLYAIRAQINSMLGQVVRGGFVLSDGYLTARFSTTDPKDGKRKPLYYGAEGGLIRWELTTGAPEFDQVLEGADGMVVG